MTDSRVTRGKTLSADIFTNVTGKKWTAELREHPAVGGEGVLVWKRADMRTQNNAEMAMESAYQRLKNKLMKAGQWYGRDTRSC